ncbi:MAG: hypothetical protein ACLT5P_15980 [Flavonifractor plautii]
MLEVSSGVSSLTGGALSGRLSMAAFMLSWAGLSVHCQVLAFLGTRPVHGVLWGKLLRPALRRPAGPADPAVSPGRPGVLCLAEQTETLAALDLHQALTISSVSAWCVKLLFLLLASRG